MKDMIYIPSGLARILLSYVNSSTWTSFLNVASQQHWPQKILINDIAGSTKAQLLQVSAPMSTLWLSIVHGLRVLDD